MKSKSIILVALTALIYLSSCTKNDIISRSPEKDRIEITADINGNFVITGHISSPDPLQKVELFKNEDVSAFLTDETDAKYQTEYDFSYTITGISQNTKIKLVAHDVNNQTMTHYYELIKN